jgi:shikimate kinase
MNIILVGMPACGKSCMGRAISKRTRMRLLDTDRLIEEKEGRLLHAIICEDGLEYFKKVEEEVLLSIEGDNMVISTGGSAIYYDSVMTHFKKIGKVVYLYVGKELIKERLGDYSKRGIVLAPGQTIDDLYEERTVLYRKYADIIINCNGKAYNKYREDLLEAIKQSR